MMSRLVVIWSLLVVSGGCIYNEEPMPRIAGDYSSVVIQPVPAGWGQARVGVGEDVPKDWVPASLVERKWTAIVIHHSGTKQGNASIFDKWHREGNHWEGVGYNFVIGNGTDSGDGQVEVTFRWRNQMTGAHCGGTAGNWANKYAVGICLVGNFNHTTPSSRQMRSLVKLVGFLQRRYGIARGHIYGHSGTPGARVTDCPGSYFSLARLKSMLAD